MISKASWVEYELRGHEAFGIGTRWIRARARAGVPPIAVCQCHELLRYEGGANAACQKYRAAIGIKFRRCYTIRFWGL